MWLEQRNGKYRYSERYKDPLSGKLRKVSVTLDRKADKRAYELLAEMVQERTRTGDYTLREAADAYLAEHKGAVRKQTYVRNKRSIDYTVDLLGGDNLIENDVDIKGTLVYVILHGACSNCAGADATLKMVVERLLQDGVDPGIKVFLV